MPEYVRVTMKDSGHKVTITRAKLEAFPNAFTELKQDATDAAGFPLEPEFKTPDAGSASAKQAGSSANTSKE